MGVIGGLELEIDRDSCQRYVGKPIWIGLESPYLSQKCHLHRNKVYIQLIWNIVPLVPSPSLTKSPS